MTDKEKHVVFSKLVREQTSLHDKIKEQQKQQAEMVSYCEGFKNLYEWVQLLSFDIRPLIRSKWKLNGSFSTKDTHTFVMAYMWISYSNS